MVIDDSKTNYKTFVVIGGAGYIGRYLVEILLRTYPDCNIIVISRNKSKGLFFSNDRISIQENLKELRFTNCAVFNLAYAGGVGFRETLNLAKKMVLDIDDSLDKNFKGRLIHVSSIAVHGKSLNQNSVSPQILRKLSKSDPYCYAKGYTEKMIHNIAKEKKIKTYIVRCGNVMGPGSTWANKIVTRLIDRQPLLGYEKEHPSNSTFIGNFVYLLANLINEESETKSLINIMNFAEFGKLSWETWVDPVANELKIEPLRWTTDDLSCLKPMLSEDLNLVKREIIKTAVPLLVKGRFTSKHLYKFLNRMDASAIKNKAKLYVNTLKNEYIDSSEHNMAQIYLNQIAFSIENVPERIIIKLPYSFDHSVNSILGWINFSGYKSLKI